MVSIKCTHELKQQKLHYVMILLNVHIFTIYTLSIWSERSIKTTIIADKQTDFAKG